MSKYIDLVLVKHKPEQAANYLFYAPFSTGLKNGDTVIVDTQAGKTTGAVVNVITVAKESNDFKFAMQAAGAKELKRVIARAVPYDYSDENYIEGVK